MFTSLELGREEVEIEKGGLSLKKNPLMMSIIDGCETLKTLVEKKEITAELVRDSKGFLMMRTDKIGLGISVTQGYGVVLIRQPSAPQGWSPPLPVKIDGFSLGAVMGYSEQHTILAMSSEDDVKAFLKDKRSMKIGLDFGVNLGKKLNQQATIDTDNTKAKNEETGMKTRAFTVSKGFLVDVSLKGTSVEPDQEDIDAAYGEACTPADILTGKVRAPKQAQLLYNALHAIETGTTSV